MPDIPRWEEAAGWSGEPGSFLPIRLEMPIGRLNPNRSWRVALAHGLYVENAPPWRLILLGDRTVAQYPVIDEAQERLALLGLVAQKWMSAGAWAAAWGLHRNTLGNWTWRYHYFGLDGLRDGVLPRERKQLQAIVDAVHEILQAQGRQVSVAVLQREVERRQLGQQPRNALQWLRARLTAADPDVAARPQAGPGLLPADPAPGPPEPGGAGPTAGSLGDKDPGTMAAGAAHGSGTGPVVPAKDAATQSPTDPPAPAAQASVSTDAPGPQGPAADQAPPPAGPGTQPPTEPPPPGAQATVSITDAHARQGSATAADQAACSEDQRNAETGKTGDALAPPAERTPDGGLSGPHRGETGGALAPPAGLGAPPVPGTGHAPNALATALPMRYGGLALALPALQSLLDPLEPYLQQAWGQRPWRYGPRTLITAFILYLLMGFRNPEQVKASPHRDFGPLLGQRRGPACITLRRRLPAMASDPQLVDGLQRELALAYLHLGWVQPGPWLVDGHFSPYFGQHPWGKGWWPQRRLAVRGYFQNWVADRRGRPLWLHLTQGFELFSDQLPLIAAGLRSLLAAAGAGNDPIFIFDRGGYSATLFAALNQRGVGWVTWLKGKVSLPAAAFTEQGTLPHNPLRPGEPPPTIHYAATTHAVAGLGAPVPVIAWHEGDPSCQVALLSNLDARFPARFTPLDQIAMIKGRWPQENAFKTMVHHFDTDWTNGYAHEPASTTPVPNPEVRRLQRKLGERTAQLRRAMDRDGLHRTAKAAARHRRKVGTIKGLLTRIRRRLALIPPLVPFAALGRSPTDQLPHGRGVFFPTLRVSAYHAHAQLRDHVAAVFPDHREWDKVLRVILHTPGRYLPGAAADRIILDPPQQPSYRRALELLISRINAHPPHAPDRPAHPLRFELALVAPVPLPLHNAPSPLPAQ